MTLRNIAGLEAQSDALFPDNSSQLITAETMRVWNQDLIDSLKPYAANISNKTQIDNIPLSSTPQRLTFDTNDISDNEIFTSEGVTNNRIIIKKNGFFLATVRLVARWSSGEDANLQVRVNGAPNPNDGNVYSQEGQGGSDPITVSVTRFGFPINQTLIDDGVTAGYGGAAVELFAWSTTGTFDFDQLQAQLGVEYVNGSIGTLNF